MPLDLSSLLGPGLSPETPEAGGGADALHSGSGCPVPGGGEPADRPPPPEGGFPFPPLEVAERWLSGCLKRLRP
jgi:hypothetical protein